MIFKKYTGNVSNILTYTTYCFYKKVFSNNIIEAYHYHNFILVKNNNNFFSIFKTFCSTSGGALIIKVFDPNTMLMTFKEWIVPSVAANLSDFSCDSTLDFFKNHILSDRFIGVEQINSFNELVTNEGRNTLAFIRFNDHRYIMDYLMLNIEIYYFPARTYVSYSNQEAEGFQFSMIIKQDDLLIEDCEENTFKQSLIREHFSKYTQDVDILFMKSFKNQSFYFFYNQSDYTGYINLNEKKHIGSSVCYRHDIKQSSYLCPNNYIQNFDRKIYEVLHFFILNNPSTHVTALLVDLSLSLKDIDNLDGMTLIEMIDI